MKISNCIDACSDFNTRTRPLEAVKLIVVHRCNIADTAAETADRFINDPEVAKYTGGMMPYTFYIRRDGLVEQALHVGDVAPHARRWNIKGLGIALSGDFRFQPPTKQQMDSLTKLCAMWLAWGITDIKGHTELPYSSRDMSKECPGRHLKMSHLRQNAEDLRRSTVENALVGAGVVF